MIECEDDPVLIGALGSEADPDGITSIGNILVYNVSDGTRYAIFLDGTYQYLGDSVPEPTVKFSTVAGSISPRSVFAAPPSLAVALGFSSTGTPPTPKDLWNRLLEVRNDNSDTEYETANTVYDRVMQGTWDDVNDMRVSLRGNNTFGAPLLARYALRLYDGNYIYVSAPVLLAGNKEHDHMRLLMGYDSSNHYYEWKVYLNNPFTASVRVDFGSGGLWGDLIEAVDIFLSTDICVPKMNANIGRAYANGTSLIGTDAGFEMEGVSDYAWLNASSTKNRFKEDFENEMVKKGNFYRVATIPAFTQAYWVEDLKPKSQDDLVVLPRLSEGEAHQTSGLGGLASYNGRLLLSGEKVTLSRGYQHPDAELPASGSGSQTLSAFFYIRGADGNTKLVKGYSGLTRSGDPDKVSAAYITYPDPRCYKAEYFIYSGASYTKITLPMKEHPLLNAAYGFWGLGYRLDELYASGDTRTSGTAASLPTEDRTYTVDNRLYLSEMDNPFFFPLGQRVTFSAKIISSMPITIPLSTGQVGVADIYIFTKEGIWASKISDEGKIANTYPVTRDVPFEGSVCQLDQGIVFATESGVKIISGMQVTDISPNMGPDRSPIGEGSASLTLPSNWTALMTIAQDTMPFLQFIKQARFVYDYPGKRLLVFREGKSYAYVYKLDTGTWHKQQMPAYTFSSSLNSYPDALVTLVSSGSFAVYDFSTRYGTNSYPVCYGLIITRSMELDAPDVRKEIKQIKLRGSFRRGGGVQYILLGSMDGKYYKQLTSLRNGSWKFYKILVLARLYPDESI